MINFLENIDGSDGFSKVTFPSAELERMRSLVREQWVARIGSLAPECLVRFQGISMDRYHEFQHLIDHKAAWPKRERILCSSSAEEILRLPTLMNLFEIVGEGHVSDEEKIGRANIYWRLVRPNAESDVGPIHADKWFWDLGHGDPISPGYRRIKLWIALFCEPGKSGFCYVPGSHLKNWSYKGELRDGIRKPIMDIDRSSLDLEIFHSEPGDGILFHDQLLHGGVVGRGLTRVSLEFTLIVPIFRKVST